MTAPAQEPGFEQTAPIFPWEIALKSASWFFQHYPDGNVELKICPAATTPNGPMPIPPGITVTFPPEAWARFQEQVAAGGVVPRAPSVEPIPASALASLRPPV